MAEAEKAAGAFRTIGELSHELGVAQHILRYWESKFPQLKPLQRAGNRRYYRPADVDLARRIHRLLTLEGYTMRGVQKLLRDKPGAAELPVEPVTAVALDPSPPAPPAQPQAAGVEVAYLVALRDRLARALDG